MTRDDIQQFVTRVADLSALRRQEERIPQLPMSISEQIEEGIKELVVSGEYAPGDRLLETDLASRFGVSRAPVREALRSLEKEGFVLLKPRRGAIVYHPTPAEVNGLYEVRAELFALAARKAAMAMDRELEGVAKNY